MEEEAEGVEEPGGGRHRKMRPLNQQSEMPMNSQRLQEQAQGPHGSAPGPLWIYHGFQFGVFMRSLSVQMAGALTLVPALGTLFPC